VSFGAALLQAVLDEHVPAAATGLVVAVSGGADSACLLAAIAQLANPPPGDTSRSVAPHGEAPRIASRLPIRAVHVDHGLQAAAVVLREASAALCARLGIPLCVVPVVVETGGGVSIEAAARDARYLGLARNLRPGECLLTAHHAQDQAETLLLQLLRGAGLAGLSAMPMCRPFGGGWHLRPLLGVAQRDLREFGEAQAITGADDPMNRDPRFDRAYLRSQLWPPLERRWPGAANVLSRTARHLSEARQLLDEMAAVQAGRLRDGEALIVAGLRALAPLEQINTVRQWLCAAAVTPPPTPRLTEALRQIFAAGPDRLPAIVWGEFALRRYRGRLFATKGPAPSLGAPREWPLALGAPLDLGPGLGRMHWAPQLGGLDAGRLPRTLSVRQRRGGEVLKVGLSAKTQSVQHLCQSAGVLPWMRDALPFIYAHDVLVAVGDLWQDARWRVAAGTPGFACRWEAAPLMA
jgi:tRNA(Ile)-lysidine synthase